jgi:glycogen debranching enzyme
MVDRGTPVSLQPLLHDGVVVLRAPAQAWSDERGRMGTTAVSGAYLGDVRLVRSERVSVGGAEGEHLQTAPEGASAVHFLALHRGLDGRGADSDVRSTLSRRVRTDGVETSFTLRSRRGVPLETTVSVELVADATGMDDVKAGVAEPVALTLTAAGDEIAWADGAVTAALTAPGAEIALDGAGITLTWAVTVPAGGEASVAWRLTATDADAVVAGVDTEVPWSVPTVAAGDDRLGRWLARALDDLDALRLTTTDDPESVFLAAGAPWFFTLFGRDSIWAARFLLPLGTELAAGTLRVLAGLQGTGHSAVTAEQPGRIMHELRRDTVEIPAEGVALPPLYYGTADATALWVNLLHDAWMWGLPDEDVRALLPHLVDALDWMRDYGDSDGDGLLEYVDETAHGLANQGWKDSADAVQWRDGTLAEGPIALCEVQGYAYEAATRGADLLEAFGHADATDWRRWAERLKERFHETFWIDSDRGAYPAIALDRDKRPVDTVTSNIGHLLGTGLLDERQASLVARRLVSPELDSGYGLRTMSTAADGYWPLGYHGGSVWTHDTAIAIAGLAREGFPEEAGVLIQGLLAAASGFDFRMPELHSGDPASELSRPVPYPAACRPQAWSAAAAVSVLASALGLTPDAPGGVLRVAPAGATAIGALTVRGLRFGEATVTIAVNADGEVTGASGADIEVG